MKRAYIFIPLILCLSFAQAQTSLMTYNIRFSTENDGDNWWELRKQAVAAMIEYYQPDIFGIQEGLHEQVTYLDKTLNSYSFVGVGRDDGQTKGEYSAIFYNTRTYKNLQNHTYWLSETPEKPSVGWDAAMERITTYGIFINKNSGDTLHVFNCHYDHIGQLARENSSKLIVSIIKKKGLDAKRVVVMGDFNSEPGSSPIRVIEGTLDDAYEKSAIPPYGPFGTFTAFNTTEIPKRRIDYIFTKNLEITSYRIIDDRRKNYLWPSDHLPVFIELKK